jgi:tRNA A37 threonylcarbamoyladenosine dehydratase
MKKPLTIVDKNKDALAKKLRENLKRRKQKKQNKNSEKKQ